MIDAGIGYSTQVFRPAEPLDMALVVQPRPDCPRGAVWCPVEGGDWLLTLSGIRGQHPPTGDSPPLDFLASLDEPYLYDHLATAEPRSPRTASATPPTGAATTTRRAGPRGLRGHRRRGLHLQPDLRPGPVRRRSRCPRPARRTGRGRDAPGLAAAAQRRIARSGDSAWLTAIGADRPYATAADTTAPGRAERARSWYVRRLLDRVPMDQVVGAAFRDVTSLTAPPSRLTSPAVVLRTVLLPRRPGFPTRRAAWRATGTRVRRQRGGRPRAASGAGGTSWGPRTESGEVAGEDRTAEGRPRTGVVLGRPRQRGEMPCQASGAGHPCEDGP
ncbi:hypothetical protein NKH77_03570 [Streptomyces sp. M19]